MTGMVRDVFISRGWVTADEWRQLERNGQAADSESLSFDPPAVVTLKARGAVRASWEVEDDFGFKWQPRGPWEEGTTPDRETARQEWRWVLAAWIADSGMFYGFGDAGIGLLKCWSLVPGDIVTVGDMVGIDRAPAESDLPISQYLEPKHYDFKAILEEAFRNNPFLIDILRDLHARD